MTPYLRTEGPIGGHLPSTDRVPAQRHTRFPEQDRPHADQDWRKQAACRNEDPEIFFPVGTGAAAERQTAQAKQVCAGCSVVEDCGQFLAHMQRTLPGSVEGVWAGTADADRNQAARRAQRARERARKRQARNEAEA